MHVLIKNGGILVSRIKNLYQIESLNHSAVPSSNHFWMLQGGKKTFRRIDVTDLNINKQIKMPSPPVKNVIFFESDPHTLWILIDNKYLHMNEKFIGQLPFDLKSDAKLMVYSESLILICESYKQCHIFELNEYYNIVNHQSFQMYDYELECNHESKTIFDAKIEDEVAFILTTTCLCKINIYAENLEHKSS